MTEKVRKPFRDAEGSIIRKEKKISTHTGRSRTEVIYYARVRYIDLDGRSREKKRTATSYTEAVDLRRTIREEIERELDPSANETIAPKTFNDLADYYQQEYMKPAEFVGDKKVAGMREKLIDARRHLDMFRKEFGTRLLKTITYEDIRNFKQRRIKTPVVIQKKFRVPLEGKWRNGVNKFRIEKRPVQSMRSLASVNRELGRLKRIFYIATRKEWLKENPFSKGETLIKSSDEVVRVRVLTIDEENQLYEKCDDQKQHMKGIISFAIDTFMRSAEIFKMTWKMVDLENGLIHLPARLTKTLTARTIPLSARALAVLRELDQQPHMPTVFGLKSVKTPFTTLRKHAGIKDLHFHDLRATGITRLLRAGMEAAEVMKFSGHSDYRTFMKYVRPDIDTFSKAKTMMDTYIES